MKKIILSLVFIFSLFGLIKAETPRFVNVKILGAYNLVGFSFDSRLYEHSKYGFKIGGGYGYSYDKGMEDWRTVVGANQNSTVYQVEIKEHTFSAPISIYRLFGKQKHFFELGLGAIPFYKKLSIKRGENEPLTDYWKEYKSKYEKLDFSTFLQTSYRYEGQKFLFSVGVDTSFQLTLYPHLSIGYRL